MGITRCRTQTESPGRSKKGWRLRQLKARLWHGSNVDLGVGAKDRTKLEVTSEESVWELGCLTIHIQGPLRRKHERKHWREAQLQYSSNKGWTERIKLEGSPSAHGQRLVRGLSLLWIRAIKFYLCTQGPYKLNPHLKRQSYDKIEIRFLQYRFG